MSRSAFFGGQSGGAITAVLTALGVPGLKQFQLFQQTLVGVAICKAQFSPAQQQEAALQCSFNRIGLPLLAAAINATGPDAAAVINNRVTLCEFGFFLRSLLREKKKKKRREREREKSVLVSLSRFVFSFSDLDGEKTKTFPILLRGVPSRRPLDDAAQRRRQGTSKWSGVEDIISNVAVSDMIPCFT